MSSNKPSVNRARWDVLVKGPANAPGHWIALRHTLRAILPHLAKYCDASTRWLIDELRRRTPEKADIPKRCKSPAIGMIGPYPLFSALAQQPETPKDLSGRRAQAALLVASARHIHFLKNQKVNLPLERAGLATRKIVRGMHRSEAIESLFLESSSLESLCEGVEALVHDTGRITKTDQNILSDLRTFLRDVLGKKDIRTRPSVEQVPKGSGRHLIVRPSASDAGAVKGFGLILEELPKETRKDRSCRALATAREGSKPVVMTANADTCHPDVKAADLPDRQANLRVVTRARAVKAANQPIPNRRDLLHLSVLASLEDMASKARTQLQKVGHESVTSEVMLSALLVLGADFEQLGTLRVSTPRSPPTTKGTPAAINPASQTILLAVPDIPDGWRPSARQATLYRGRSSFINLPIPGFSALFLLLQEYAAVIQSGSLFPLLANATVGSSEYEKIREGASDALKNCNKLRRTNATLHQLSRHLERQVTLIEGDHAEAELLSCRLQGQWDTRRYYYAPAAPDLAKRYLSVWQPLSQISAIAVSPQLSPTTLRGQSAETHWVGSRAVPTHSSAHKAVKSAKGAVDRVTGGRPWPERLRQRHNALTCYVTWQIYWMTGMRPVLDPIDMALYDSTRGLLAVCDKETADKYAGRLVWLPPPVQRQIRVYRDLARESSDAIFGQHAESPEFRIIDPELRLHQIAQQTPKSILGSWYPFPENSHRHYLRTRLRELSVDGGIVDALLGHSNVGHEPYARHSALSPQTLIKSLEQPLETIWRELEWEVLPRARQ